MLLFASTTSPYARKIRALVLEKGLDCPLVEANAWAADSPIPALNPLGKVPVLVLDDGEPLFDSPLIAEVLDALASPRLLPQAEPARLEALRWQALADGMMDVAVTWLLESRRADGQRDAVVLQRQHDKLARCFAFADARVPAPGVDLVAGAFGLADIALAVAIEYVDFRYPHDWRSACPRLHAWHLGVRDRPCLAATRPPA